MASFIALQQASRQKHDPMQFRSSSGQEDFMRQSIGGSMQQDIMLDVMHTTMHSSMHPPVIAAGLHIESLHSMEQQQDSIDIICLSTIGPIIGCCFLATRAQSEQQRTIAQLMPTVSCAIFSHSALSLPFSCWGDMR